MSHAIVITAFALGLLFGSFLNVCIRRLPRGESVVHPRSYCPECGAPIRWYDNVPLLSWVLLRGQCRGCKRPIPWRYPIVELAVGVWFTISAGLFFSNSSRHHDFAGSFSSSDFQLAIAAGAFAILGFLLIGLMVMDWETMLLPDAFTLGGIFVALLLVCTQAIFLGPGEDQVVLNTTHQLRLNSPGGFMSRGNVFLTGPESLIFGRIIAACGAALLLLLIRWLYKAARRREGMGLGDVKLLAMIAAFLGFWPSILALFIGVFVASLYGAVLLVRGKAGAASRLPFGSFLCLGGLVSAVFGNGLIDRYIALFR